MPLHILGIEVGSERLAFGHAGDEGGVAVQIRPRAFVEPEVVETFLGERRGVLAELFVQGAVAAPELVHEHQVEDARGLYQLWQGLAVAGGEPGLIDGQRDGREAGAHFFQMGQIRHNSGGG